MRNLTLVSCCMLVAGGVLAAPPAAKKAVSTPVAVAKPAEAMPVFVRSASNSTAAIRVLVNGDPVTFDTGEPVQFEGRVLVPMREVFEALGATVTFNKETRSLEAVRGNIKVSLRPGEQTALLNGEVHPLDNVTQVVNGATVIPLRFISEAFGARVSWNADDYDVTVNTDALLAKKLPVAPEGYDVFGSLTGIYPEARLLTVRMAGGENVQVPLVRNTNATRRTKNADGKITVEGAAGAFEGGALRLGEQVQVEFNENHKGVLVLVDTHERHGVMKSVTEVQTSGGHQITLSDGSVIMLKPDATVTFAGRTVPLSDVKADETVSIRLNDAGQGIALAVTTPGDTATPATPAP